MPFCVDLERKLWSMSLLWIGKNPNLGEKIYDKTWKFTFCQSVTWRTLEDSKVVWCGWICWIITTLSTLDNMGKKQGHGRVTQWMFYDFLGGWCLGNVGLEPHVGSAPGWPRTLGCLSGMIAWCVHQDSIGSLVVEAIASNWQGDLPRFN